MGLSQLPRLTVLFDDGATSKKLGAFLQQEWKQKLNIEINVEYLSARTRLQRMQSHNFDIAWAGWGADFNDPINFLDMFVTGADFNDANYSNPDYDTLIQKAQQEKDAVQRMQFLYDAEKLLMEDMPVAPSRVPHNPRCEKSYVKGWLTVPAPLQNTT